jgi:hypothetical protein
MFEILLEEQSATPDDLLAWGVHDRLGVVVTEPYGLVGCSLMVQLATAAFYDARPARRDEPQYAEIYAFHVGRPCGDLSHYDLRPRRKEVFLGPEDDLLSEINARAVTHLLLPEASPRSSTHTYKEPEAVIDRIKSCVVYAPSGIAQDPDVTIQTRDENALADTFATLDPRETVSKYRGMLGLPATEDRVLLERAIEANLQHIEDGEERSMYRDAAAWISRFEERIPEVSDSIRGEVLERWKHGIHDGRASQSYRRVSPEEAISLLPGETTH